MDNSDVFSKIMEKKKDQSILNDDQVIIFDTSYHFRQILLFDESIRVSLPNEFVPMGKDWATQKYPYIL